MKILVILLLLIVFGFTGISFQTHAQSYEDDHNFLGNDLTPPKSESFSGTIDLPPLEIWNKHEMILDGTIVEKIQYDEFANYHIKINKVFKGNIKSESVSGFANPYVFNYLNEGDRALIYIGLRNEITPYTVKTNEICDARSLIQISPVLPNDDSFVRGVPRLPPNWHDPCVPDYFTYDPDFFNYRVVTPPKMQLRHNVPIDLVRCYDDKILIFKDADNSPACVKPETKQKLVERGWATKDSDIKCDNNDDFDLIRYSESDDIHPQRLVAFLREGTTGVICLQYISNLDNEGFYNIDESLHQRDSSDEVSANVVLNAIPNKVSRESGTDVTVAYEIRAKNNSTGIYWINLSQLCDSLHVVVWDDEPRVSEDDIPVRTGVKHCPAKFLDVNIIGYSGLDLQYHSAKPT